jgi:hypothetical protein
MEGTTIPLLDRLAGPNGKPHGQPSRDQRSPRSPMPKNIGARPRRTSAPRQKPSLSPPADHQALPTVRTASFPGANGTVPGTFTMVEVLPGIPIEPGTPIGADRRPTLNLADPATVAALNQQAAGMPTSRTTPTHRRRRLLSLERVPLTGSFTIQT